VGPGETLKTSSGHDGLRWPVTPFRRRIAAILIGLATAIVIVAIAILPFLTPQWIAFEQDRSQATAWKRFPRPTSSEPPRVAVVADLILGGDYHGPGRWPARSHEHEQAHHGGRSNVFRGCGSSPSPPVIVLIVASRRRDRNAHLETRSAAAPGLTFGVVVLAPWRWRLRPALRSSSTRSSSTGVVPVRSAHRSAGPALPVPVLAGDRDRGWGSSSSDRRGVAWVAGKRAMRGLPIQPRRRTSRPPWRLVGDRPRGSGAASVEAARRRGPRGGRAGCYGAGEHADRPGTHHPRRR